MEGSRQMVKEEIKTVPVCRKQGSLRRNTPQIDKKLPRTKSELSKVTRYNHSEKKTKYLSIDLTKQVWELSTENYKMLMNKIFKRSKQTARHTMFISWKAQNRKIINHP